MYTLCTYNYAQELDYVYAHNYHGKIFVSGLFKIPEAKIAYRIE